MAKTISDYQADWAAASATGNQAAMDAAHTGAEAIRASQGYSGGDNGSEHNVNSFQPVVNFFDKLISRKTNTDEVPFNREWIFGLPLKYTSLTDPDTRVYKQTIGSDVPVVSFIPGAPKFLGGLGSKTTNVADQEFLERIYKGFVEDDNESKITSFLSQNSRSFKDLRYYSFEPIFFDYFKHVQLLLSALHVKMGLGPIYNFAEDYSSMFEQKGSLSFYLEKSSSVTESASTDMGESKLAGLAKTGSGFKRELDFLLGKNLNFNDLESMQAQENTQDSDANSTVKGLLDSGHLFDLIKLGKSNVATSLINGSQLLFPEIWQDSTFSRNIDLSFKLYSPYGDPLSVFHNVYVPFVFLLAFSLPRQESLMGYHSPFILRVDCPGWFCSDMGIVTSLSFKKGENSSWSIRGLPTEIEVTLSIKDLYPALMITKSYTMLAYNVGLSQYLDNMAGIAATDLKIGSTIMSILGSKISAIFGAPTAVEASLVNKLAGMRNWMNSDLPLKIFL